MPGVYDHHLPGAFPHRAVLPYSLVIKAVHVLLSYKMLPSSFSITSEYGPESLVLWMSDVSYNRLKDRDDFVAAFSDPKVLYSTANLRSE